MLGLFERRAKGLSWAAITRWANENGLPDITTKGVQSAVHNPAYTGQARWGATATEDAHPAIVTKGLWRRCQARGTQFARTGKLAGRFLLQGLAECTSCGRALYLTTGGHRGNAQYACKNPHCTGRAYAQADRLDSFVLNTLEEELNPADPSTWVPVPGDSREAEAALGDARADLDGYLADTTLRRTLGAEMYNRTVADYVAVVNKCEADLESARAASPGGAELVGRLWNTEWGVPERREWLSRMVRSVSVGNGRAPLSERADVELR